MLRRENQHLDKACGLAHGELRGERRRLTVVLGVDLSCMKVPYLDMTTAAATVPGLSTLASRAWRPGDDRLMSLDALRGFDMFWIIGGNSLLLCLANVLGYGKNPPWLCNQLTHPMWNGFTFNDLIFPLFVFLVGVAIPYSLAKYIERGEDRARLYWRIGRRTVLLVLFGLICNGLLQLDFANLRYPNVLVRIGVVYLFAAMLMLHTSVCTRIAWIVVLLLGYWAAMMWIPVPGCTAGNLNPGQTLADFIDRAVLPGKLYEGVRDPEGILSTVPAIATALLGVLAGQWLREARCDGQVKAAALLIAAPICLALGYLWSFSFPINKNLWSSSFVLWAGGWSLMLLGLFYLVIDVWDWRKWAFVFVVIGVNAITIFIAQCFIDFDAIGQLLFSQARVHQAMLPASGLLVKWLCLCLLYRQRIFLRL